MACLRSHGGLTASCRSAQTPCQVLPLNTGASPSAWPYLAVRVWVPRKGKHGGFERLGCCTFPHQINEPLCVLMKGLEVSWW